MLFDFPLSLCEFPCTLSLIDMVNSLESSYSTHFHLFDPHFLSLFFTFLQTFGSLVVALFHGFSYLSSASVRENERRKIFLCFTFPSLFYFFTVRSLNQPAYNTPNESPSLLSPSLYLQSLSLNLAEENLL